MTLWLDKQTVAVQMFSQLDVDAQDVDIDDSGDRVSLSIQFDEQIEISSVLNEWDNYISALRGCDPTVEIAPNNNGFKITITGDKDCYRE